MAGEKSLDEKWTKFMAIGLVQSPSVITACGCLLGYYSAGLQDDATIETLKVNDHPISLSIKNLSAPSQLSCQLCGVDNNEQIDT